MKGRYNVTDITPKGELKLCAEGQRLYDDYCEVFDDATKNDYEMLDAWDAYYNHRMKCLDCGYK